MRIGLGNVSHQIGGAWGGYHPRLEWQQQIACGREARFRLWPFATCGPQAIVGRFRGQADIRQHRSLTAHVPNDPERKSSNQFLLRRVVPTSGTVAWAARISCPVRGKAMRRRSKAGGKTSKSPRHEAATPKRRRTAPKAVPSRRSATPPEETKIARLTRERDEALEREKAAAEVLRVISCSSANIQPVFDAMLENAVRVCGAVGGGICRWDGDALHHVAVRWAKPAFAELLMRTPIHPNPRTNMGRMIRTKTVVHVTDLAAEFSLH